MKKRTFTFLLASFTTLSLLAADITNRITVSFTGNNDYELRIDGRRYQSNNDRIYLKNMRPGRHSIQVYALDRRNRTGNKPVYASNFTVRPQHDLHMTVDRRGRVYFDETRNRDDRNNRDWNDRNDRNDRDWRDRDDRDSRDRDHNDDWRSDNNYSRAMSANDYSQVVQRIRGQWTGNSKYNTAKDAVGRYYFSSEQVRGLLQLVSSESQRLELAKMAYRNTVDKQAYNQVYSLFSRSAQRELDDYTRSNRY